MTKIDVDVASTVAFASVVVVVVADFVVWLTNDTVWTSAWKSVCSVGQIISGYWLIGRWRHTPDTLSKCNVPQCGIECTLLLGGSRTKLKESQQLSHISNYLCPGAVAVAAWLFITCHMRTCPPPPFIECVSTLQARNAKTFAIFRYVLRGFINLPATQHAFDLCLIRSSNKLITIIDWGLEGFNYNNNRNRSISKICIMICK